MGDCATRIAFISDIHGNGTALRAILGELECHDIDGILCLGDLCCGGPEPGECLRLIRESADWCILGNTDEALLRYHGARPREAADFDEGVRWTGDLPTDSQWSYLADLPVTLTLPMGKESLTAFHGSPESSQREWKADDFLFWTRQQTGPSWLPADIPIDP